MASRIVAAATVKAVKSRRPIPTRAALVLTPAAVNKIKELLAGKSEYIGLKVGVRQRGCNGLSYTLDYASEKGKLDEEVVQDGLSQLVLVNFPARFITFYCPAAGYHSKIATDIEVCTKQRCVIEFFTAEPTAPIEITNAC